MGLMEKNLLSKNLLWELRQSSPDSVLPNPKCRIRATNDIEAMERWLDEYFDKATTFRTYKKEAERFLAWCLTERGVNLKNFNRDDVEAYVLFLKNPIPKEKWCGPKGSKSKSKKQAWYPFAGPLSSSAIKTALAVLNSFLGYLVDAGYLEHNAFSLIRLKGRFKDEMADRKLTLQERILNQEEWLAILDALNNEPYEPEQNFRKKNRLNLLINILYFLGLRIHELEKSTWSNFKNINEKWWFMVKGKGGRLGKIPVNTHLLQIIIRYRHEESLSPLPSVLGHETRPIICSLTNTQQALSARQMSNLIKDLACKAAKNFSDNPVSQKKLRSFSPHWLRHLSASRQDLAGISFTHIKENLRHKNEETTRHYVHAFDDARHKEMEKLSLE